MHAVPDVACNGRPTVHILPATSQAATVSGAFVVSLSDGAGGLAGRSYQGQLHCEWLVLSSHEASRRDAAPLGNDGNGAGTLSRGGSGIYEKQMEIPQFVELRFDQFLVWSGDRVIIRDASTGSLLGSLSGESNTHLLHTDPHRAPFFGLMNDSANSSGTNVRPTINATHHASAPVARFKRPASRWPPFVSASGMVITFITDAFDESVYLPPGANASQFSGAGFSATTRIVVGCSHNSQCSYPDGRCTPRGTCACIPGVAGADCSFASCLGQRIEHGLRGEIRSSALALNESERYPNDAECEWILEGAQWLADEFASLEGEKGQGGFLRLMLEWDLEESFDFVEVYDSAGVMHVQLSGFGGPTLFTIPCGQEPPRIRFVTDGTGRRSGFIGHYEFAHTVCELDAHCSNLGTCVDGVCVCQHGAYGLSCGSNRCLAFNLLNSWPLILSLNGGSRRASAVAHAVSRAVAAEAATAQYDARGGLKTHPRRGNGESARFRSSIGVRGAFDATPSPSSSCRWRMQGHAGGSWIPRETLPGTFSSEDGNIEHTARGPSGAYGWWWTGGWKGAENADLPTSGIIAASEIEGKAARTQNASEPSSDEKAVADMAGSEAGAVGPTALASPPRTLPIHSSSIIANRGSDNQGMSVSGLLPPLAVGVRITWTRFALEAVDRRTQNQWDRDAATVSHASLEWADHVEVVDSEGTPIVTLATERCRYDSECTRSWQEGICQQGVCAVRRVLNIRAPMPVSIIAWADRSDKQLRLEHSEAIARATGCVHWDATSYAHRASRRENSSSFPPGEGACGGGATSGSIGDPASPMASLQPTVSQHGSRVAAQENEAVPARFLDALSGSSMNPLPGAAGIWEALASCPSKDSPCYAVGGKCARRHAPATGTFIRAAVMGASSLFATEKLEPPQDLEKGSCMCPVQPHTSQTQQHDAVLEALGDASALVTEVVTGAAITTHSYGSTNEGATTTSYACDCPCIPEPPAAFWASATGMLLMLAIGFSLFPIFFVIWGTLRCARGLKRAFKAKKEQLEAARSRVRHAIFSVFHCRYPAAFISYEKLASLGRLEPHEKLRDLGQLTILDTHGDLLDFVRMNPTVFCSHQWLAWDTPDPHNVHYPAILEACERLCEREGVAADKLYVWVDYVSIPQANEHLKSLSISSLGAYASSCRYFVVVAPPTTHVDTGLPADVSSYAKRGWVSVDGSLAIGGLLWACPTRRMVLPGTQCSSERPRLLMWKITCSRRSSRISYLSRCRSGSAGTVGSSMRGAGPRQYVLCGGIVFGAAE
mmetsp:Transcript_3990/g.12676  ORF Transcript_3990/g.12676 Transcript_3990/m.12676 type:complete len:1287 (-) Transcript_3990:1959-5819(-)